MQVIGKVRPPRQPLEDTLGVVVDVVVVRRGGYGGSFPEFVEHELLLGRVERRARNGVPSGVDVLFGPALSYEGGEFRAQLSTRDLGEQLKCFCMLPPLSNARGCVRRFRGRHGRVKGASLPE